MSTVGQREKSTQERVVALFRDRLGYDYLGNWKDRENNSNIEENLLRAFLKSTQHYDDILINRALFEFQKTASDQSRSLYDVNRATYVLLRYGVKVKPEIGENYSTVWLIDWETPHAIISRSPRK